MKNTGFFITFEGVDGCGKSTQASRLVQALETDGLRVIHTRQPGGTALGKHIRELFLHMPDEVPGMSELFLMGADRFDHVEKVIRPALASGAIVVSERYADSSLAYQGYGRGIDVAVIQQVNDLATGGLIPDLTVWLDMDPEKAAARRTGAQDRLEAEDVAFFQRVRKGYARIAAADNGRFVTINADQPEEKVYEAVWQAVAQRRQ